MKHATNCKFCKNPITIDIDDGYSQLGDPYKLIQMAACNRCADIRVEKRMIENRIKSAAMMYSRSSPKNQAKIEPSIRETLIECTKKYANMIARWHFMDGMSWDEECVNQIMDNPSQWTDCVERLWKMFRDSNPERA